MRRLIIFLLCLCPTGLAMAQTFGGYNTSPDAGIYGVYTNPATAASTHFKLDVNLFGFSGNAGNTYASMTKQALFGKVDTLRRDRDYFLKTNSPRNQNVWGQVDILMPSVLYSIDETQSVAFTWRVRGVANGGPLSTRNANFLAIGYPDPSYSGTTFNIPKTAGTFNAWNEFGFTYARVLREGMLSRLKGGVTLKYLSGIASGYGVVDHTSFTLNNGHSMTINSGQAIYGYSENIDKENNEGYYNLVNFPGVGADIGFTYDWRPDDSGGDYATYGGNEHFNDDADSYKLRLGVSVTDIGGITYKNSAYNVDLNLQTDNIDPHLLNKQKGESLSKYYSRVKQYFTRNDVIRNKYYMSLPTALHLSADYQWHDGWAISGNAVFGLNTTSQNNFKNNLVSMATLTPRYEFRNYSAFLPISMNRYHQVDVGLGLRLGPVLIGSNGLFNFLASSDINRADFFLAVRLWTFPSGKHKEHNGGALRQVQCAK